MCDTHTHKLTHMYTQVTSKNRAHFTLIFFFFLFGQSRSHRNNHLTRHHTQLTTLYTTRCHAVCCNVLQRVEVCCSVLQRVSTCCSVQHSIQLDVTQCVAMCCSVLKCVAACCSVFQRVAAYNTLYN